MDDFIDEAEAELGMVVEVVVVVMKSLFPSSINVNADNQNPVTFSFLVR